MQQPDATVTLTAEQVDVLRDCFAKAQQILGALPPPVGCPACGGEMVDATTVFDIGRRFVCRTQNCRAHITVR